MKPKYLLIFSHVSTILLSICLFVVAVGIFAFGITGNKNYYHQQFIDHDTLTKLNEPYYNSEGFIDQMDYSESDLNLIIDTIIDYLFDKTSDMQVKVDDKEVFSNQALIHMKDVKALYQGGLKLVIASAIIMLLCIGFIIYYYVKIDKLYISKLLLKTAIITAITIFVIAGVIGILMLIDFDKTFYYFHTLIFEKEKVADAFFSSISNYEELPHINNLVLITILQEDIFVIAGIIIISGTVLSYAIYVVIALLLYKHSKKINTKTI